MTRARHRTTAALLAGALLATGCDLTGAPPPAPSPSPGTAALGSQAPDPHVAALASALGDLRVTVASARDALGEAQRATGDEAAEAAERAVTLLAAEAELAQGAPAPTPRPLFPGPATSREETIDYGDAFTATLSAARAAGPAGAPVLDLLRDPVAGDVGGWQRDAAGMLELIEDAASAGGDVAAAEEAVVALDGEGTRALAWALLAADTRDEDRRAAFAERGVAHLDVVLTAVDELLADDDVREG